MDSELERLRAQLRTFQQKYQKEQEVNRELALRLHASKADAQDARQQLEAARAQLPRRPSASHIDAPQEDSKAHDVAAAPRSRGGSRTERFGTGSESVDAPHTQALEMRRLESEVSALRRVIAAIAVGKSLHDAVRWEVTFSRVPDSVRVYMQDLGMGAALKPLPALRPRAVPLFDVFAVVGPSVRSVAEVLRDRFVSALRQSRSQPPPRGTPAGRERTSSRGSSSEVGGISSKEADASPPSMKPPRSGVASQPEDAAAEPLAVLEPEVLLRFPTDADLPTSGLPAFCFPQGAHIKAVPPQSYGKTDAVKTLFGRFGLRRGPRSHMFVLTGADNEDQEIAVAAAAASVAGHATEARTRYCLCLQVAEPVSRALLRQYASLQSGHPVEESTHDITCDTVVSLPRTFCIVSRYPFFDLHFDVLRLAAAMWRRSLHRELQDLAEEGFAAVSRIMLGSDAPPLPVVHHAPEGPRASVATADMNAFLQDASADSNNPVSATEVRLAVGTDALAGTPMEVSRAAASETAVMAPEKSSTLSGLLSPVAFLSSSKRTPSDPARRTGSGEDSSTPMSTMLKSAWKSWSMTGADVSAPADASALSTPSADAAPKQASSLWSGFSRAMSKRGVPALDTSSADDAPQAARHRHGTSAFTGIDSPALDSTSSVDGDSSRSLSDGHSDGASRSGGGIPVAPMTGRSMAQAMTSFFGGMGLSTRRVTTEAATPGTATTDTSSDAFAAASAAEDTGLPDDDVSAAEAVLQHHLMPADMGSLLQACRDTSVVRDGGIIDVNIPSPLQALYTVLAEYGWSGTDRGRLSFHRSDISSVLEAETSAQCDSVFEDASDDDEFCSERSWLRDLPPPHLRVLRELLRPQRNDRAALHSDDGEPVPVWQLGCDLQNPETMHGVASWAAPILFSLLPIDSVMLLLGAALTEQKIVFVGNNVSQEAVACAVIALAALLRPLSWVGPFLPTLPDDLSAVLSAPIPILVGVPELPDDYEQDEQTVLVLLNRETVRIPAVRTHESDGDKVHLLPGFLEIQLPDNSSLYHKLEPLSRLLRVGSGSGSGAAIETNQVRPCYRPTQQQVGACAQLIAAFNHHVSVLLAQTLAAGVLELAVNEPHRLGAAGGGEELSAASVRLIPPISTCVAAMLERVPEVSAPFWSRFLASQMLSVFYEARVTGLHTRLSLAPDVCAGPATAPAPTSAPTLVSPPSAVPSVRSPESVTTPAYRAMPPVTEPGAQLHRPLSARLPRSSYAVATLRRGSVDVRNLTLGPAGSAGGDNVIGFGFPVTAGARRAGAAWTAAPSVASATVAIRGRDAPTGEDAARADAPVATSRPIVRQPSQQSNRRGTVANVGDELRVGGIASPQNARRHVTLLASAAGSADASAAAAPPTRVRTALDHVQEEETDAPDATHPARSGAQAAHAAVSDSDDEEPAPVSRGPVGHRRLFSLPTPSTVSHPARVADVVVDSSTALQSVLADARVGWAPPAGVSHGRRASLQVPTGHQATRLPPAAPPRTAVRAPPLAERAAAAAAAAAVVSHAQHE